ncbi:UNVERIFIED_CONTAM: hypothetical protein GTU68_016733 [Idotea baltica]|nr:hypothetical protein [Idotea baltica]
MRGTLKIMLAGKAPGWATEKSNARRYPILTAYQLYLRTEDGFKLDQATVDMLGTCDKVVIDKDNTTVVNGKGKASDIKARVGQIKSQIETTTSDYDQEKLQERLAKLSGGVAVLYVGAPTEVEMKEKKDRVDDALHATRAAVEEGIVPGGGVALLRAIAGLGKIEGANDDQQTGIDIVKKALQSPLRTIAENAGLEGSVIVAKVLDGKKTYGFNARTEVFEDLMKAGVIDPTKVTRVALENAASIASMLLTTEAIIVDKPSEDGGAPMGGMPGGMPGGMGGMM